MGERNLLNKIKRKISFSNASWIENTVLLLGSLFFISYGMYSFFGGCTSSRIFYYCGSIKDFRSWFAFLLGIYYLYLWWIMEEA